jgi:hypothetical protein
VITNRRTLTYVAIALIVGAALALAVALARSDSPAASSGPTATQTRTQGGVLGDATGAGTIESADPAKQEPLLDKFTAKDPFVPLAVATPAPNPTSTSSPNPSLSARVKVNGTTYTVVEGDSVPGSSPAFTISGITSGDVTFAVIAEGGLENGDSSISVNLGESVRATLANGKSYDLSVLSIGASGGDGGSSNGHSLSVLSITSSNGTAMATFQVDGKTYSDKTVGVVFSTSAGEIKVIAINVDAQTVTIVLGDQTITLRAGQVVVK